MTGDDLTSVEQDSWKELAEAVREHFRRQVPKLSDMRPADVTRLLEGMRHAMGLEFAAMTWDASLEKIKREF